MKKCILALSIFIASCQAPQHKGNELSVDCWGGKAQKIGLNLTAKVEESILDGVSLDAGVKNEVIGGIVSNWKVSEENAVKLYSEIRGCIKENQEYRLKESKIREETIQLKIKEEGLKSEHEQFTEVKVFNGEKLAKTIEEAGLPQLSDIIREKLISYNEYMKSGELFLADEYRKEIIRVSYEAYEQLRNSGQEPVFDPTFSDQTLLTNHDLVRGAALKEQSAKQDSALDELKELLGIQEDEFSNLLNEASKNNCVGSECDYF